MIRLSSLTLCLTLCTAGAGAQAARPQNEEISRFITQLKLLRSGDRGEATELLETAEVLCREYSRCDARDVVGYYLALEPGELAQGLRDEARYLELRERLAAAGSEGLSDDVPWPELRADLYEELSQLAQEVEARADFVPAAQAYSLLARIEFSELEDDLSINAQRSAYLFTLLEQHIDRSVELFERAGQVTPRLEPLWLRGRLARARQRHVLAQRLFEDCLQHARQVGRREYQERGLQGLVNLAKDAGSVERVDALLAQWARLCDPQESWPLAREHTARLLAEDRPERALAFLLEHAPEHALERDQWRGMLAVTYMRVGDLTAARREIAALDSTDGEFPPLALAALRLEDGDPDAAIDLLGRERTHWRSRSSQGRVEARVILGEAWLLKGRPDLALPVLRSVLDEARAREQVARDGSGSIVGEWIGLHAVTLLARAHAELGQPLEAAAVVEDSQCRMLRQAGVPVGIDEITGWAARFERGLVSFGVGADETILVWVTADGEASARTLPIGRRLLGTAVRRLREAAIAGDRPRSRALGTEIAASLIPDELRAHILDSRPQERLLFVLHGPLEALPIALLPFGDQTLDQVLTPVVLPGLPGEDGDRTPALAQDARWTLLGSPLTGDTGVPGLPAASRELAQLARLHPDAQLFTGASFVKDAFEAALRSGGPLHVATHLTESSTCNDTRLAPVGLLLSHGQVLCPEAVLAAEARLPLVVLSACETASGRRIDAEGTHGVGRAFLEAGTRNLLVTLWPVEDEVAQRFALLFHGELGKGATPAAAARGARRSLAEQGYGPEDWACFRLMGRD